ncbi:lipoprotein [Burkholderia lata]|uniref:Lipoprotein n=1 Tax=Burkholderia lata (strain ATCC 17760 / DSM 23089 / LMG 22485 / NCIMB 9086 / R18194 / 383) TaxID=482957 RepID=A0A6P2YSS8_BURL3|nr:DUF3304 domain-containing protein [Burkholderia lata]VWD22149.1 lipoprotein [Burkholderia lata]
MLTLLRRLACHPTGIAVLLLGGAWQVHAQTTDYGPYRVTGYNYTDRSISLFTIDDFGAGGSTAHKSGGGGKTVCCMSVPRDRKTWHIKIHYELTQEQYAKDLPDDVYETDIPIPALPDKHDGYIEFHFFPGRKIEAQWVSYPIGPRIPRTTSNTSSTTN